MALDIEAQFARKTQGNLARPGAKGFGAYAKSTGPPDCSHATTSAAIAGPANIGGPLTHGFSPV
ncbi:hypothetical protein [Novosphingobium sp. BL-52-GroH]|uniref:hypothetical protein n=1 Tax=Novosphingobium sp. BL-52-GroH TaxID=3349877 RepID=UPI00384FD8F3